MEIVLQEDFPALGYVGDRVRVKPGYARNFLIPRGVAVEARSANARLLRHKMSQIEAKKAKLKAAALEQAKSFEGLVLEYTLRIGEKGKSFGSVSHKDIEQGFKEKSIELDRKQIRIIDPIKGGGEYQIEVKLHSEVVIPVTVRVSIERAEKKEARVEDGETRGSRRKGRGGKRGSERESVDGTGSDDGAIQESKDEHSS